MHQDKINLFEYFLKELVNWFCSYHNIGLSDFNNHQENDLSKLKVFKLHFFACTKNDRLISIFNSFHALPYGHVESDVYNSLSELQFCKLDSVKLTITNEKAFMEQKPYNSDLIDTAIIALRKENKELIAASAFDLVELSHRWFSWRYTFEEARNQHQFSKFINPYLILSEEKIYSL